MFAATSFFDLEMELPMLNRRLFGAIAALALLATGGVSALAQEKSIVVASTTSTQDSGLFDHILPLFCQMQFSTELHYGQSRSAETPTLSLSE